MQKIFLSSFLIGAFNFSFAQTVSDTFPLLPLSVNTKKDVIQEAEHDASFPGGDIAFKKFILLNARAISDSASYRKIKKGDYVVSLTFMIDKAGNVKALEAICNPLNSFLETACIVMIEKSPKWLPAFQNNRFVNARRRQRIQFVIE